MFKSIGFLNLKRFVFGLSEGYEKMNVEMVSRKDSISHRRNYKLILRVFPFISLFFRLYLIIEFYKKSV